MQAVSAVFILPSVVFLVVRASLMPLEPVTALGSSHTWGLFGRCR